ncbi:MAG: MarR family winged helix-turn-helix transcriptional regulator [Thiobacillus sp.]
MKSQAPVLFDLSERLGTLTRARLRQSGLAQGLQAIHLQVLMYLAQANRLSNTPQGTTEYLGLTKGTVSQSILVLARKRLITRHSDERDGRVVRLVLTERAQQLLKEISPHTLWRDALQPASPARVSSAMQVLRQVLVSLQAQAGQRTFGVCVTCRHNQRIGPRSYFCALIQEKLSSPEVRLICRVHAPPDPG